MKKLFIIMLMVCFTGVVFSEELTPYGDKLTDEQVKIDIKKSVAGKYPDNFNLQRILYNGHWKAYRKSKVVDKSGALGRMFEKRVKAYYPSYTLIMILYNGDVKAKAIMDAL